jgi:hypothetical protein
MKNIYEVLRQKEIELVRLRQEVDALKLIIPLVQDDETWQADCVTEARAALKKIFQNPDANELTNLEQGEAQNHDPSGLVPSSLAPPTG